MIWYFQNIAQNDKVPYTINTSLEQKCILCDSYGRSELVPFNQDISKRKSDTPIHISRVLSPPTTHAGLNSTGPTCRMYMN